MYYHFGDFTFPVCLIPLALLSVSIFAVISTLPPQEPGQMLTAGVYPIHYVAMDPYRNRGKCSFTITVFRE